MEPVINAIVGCSSFMVPVMAMWAIVTLYLQRDDCESTTTQLLYFGTLLLIAFITVRTMATNDPCWLIHTATLGITIVAGAMRRPAVATTHFVPDLTQ